MHLTFHCNWGINQSIIFPNTAILLNYKIGRKKEGKARQKKKSEFSPCQKPTISLTGVPEKETRQAPSIPRALYHGSIHVGVKSYFFCSPEQPTDYIVPWHTVRHNENSSPPIYDITKIAFFIGNFIFSKLRRIISVQFEHILLCMSFWHFALGVNSSF